MFTLLAATSYIACKSPDNPSASEETDEPDSTFVLMAEGPPVTKEYSTQSGRIWSVTQNQLGESLSRVKIEPRGFTEDNQPVEFGEIDPVIDIFQADLDKNGFEELYLITQAVGSGSYSTVYGLNSNNDKSVSEIYFEGATPYNSKPGEPYEGYMGHDKFEIVDSILVNTIPVFKEGDSNDNPTGGKRKVYYALIKGEASFQLKPIRSEQVK